MIGKVRQTILQHVRGHRHRIRFVAVLKRDGQVADLPCQQYFERVGLGFGAESGREHLIAEPAQQRQGS